MKMKKNKQGKKKNGMKETGKKVGRSFFWFSNVMCFVPRAAWVDGRTVQPNSCV
jgi:hypothetical protein